MIHINNASTQQVGSLGYMRFCLINFPLVQQPNRLKLLYFVLFLQESKLFFFFFFEIVLSLIIWSRLENSSHSGITGMS